MPPPQQTLPCHKCRASLALEALLPGGRVFCPMCGAGMEITLFPAIGQMTRPPETGNAGAALSEAGESGCFYHAGKKAVAPCDHCGRFLCGLCAIDFGDEKRCAGCLESGRKKGAIAALEARRINYDSICLGLAVLPPFTIVGNYFLWLTAPLAIILSFWFWNRPRGIFRRGKWRYILAILIGGAEIIGITWAIYMIILSIRNGK